MSDSNTAPTIDIFSYDREPSGSLSYDGVTVPSFMSSSAQNIDYTVVTSFGEEWTQFNSFSLHDVNLLAATYFDIVTPTICPSDAIVLDAGCGMGRWSFFLADRVKRIEAIDPSQSIIQAARFLRSKKNVRATQASIDSIPFPDNSFDFVMCLGVLHHLPNPVDGLERLAAKLRPGGHILAYLYYALDNKGSGYRFIFKCANIIRKIIWRLPGPIKRAVCELIAIGVYLPCIALAACVRALFPGREWYRSVPLYFYIGKSLKIIRTDALDRFGTKIEHRYSRKELEAMFRQAGFSEIVFSEKEPYWHLVAKKRG